MSDLGRKPAERKDGNQWFTMLGQNREFNLLDFWQWNVSDLLSNATRGRLAEYIVARALGIDTTKSVRDEWCAFDLTGPNGVKVEVKSAAYLQAWYQKKLSSISFGVRSTRAWSADTGEMDKAASRQADVYVFALLAHKRKLTVDPIRLEQWRFYVLPTCRVAGRTRSQHSITLASLQKLTKPVCFDSLARAVSLAAEEQRQSLAGH